MNHARTASLRRARAWLALSGCAAILVGCLVLAPSGEAKRILGSADADRLMGTANRDLIKARAGNDVASGRKRADRIRGHGGDDRLRGGGGGDRIGGGTGADVLVAVDGRRDRRLNGGADDDLCKIDQVDLDVLLGCEELTVRGGENGTPEGDLTLTSASGLTCDQAAPLCPFQLNGRGADGLVGAIAAGGGDITLASGAGVNVNPDGTWSAAGLYGCTGNGYLTVTIGDESVDVPVTCETQSP